MEQSLFWNTNGIGDGGSGHDIAAISAWMQAVFSGRANGILQGVLNELAVSGTTSPLTVASGAAMVQGRFYENDAPLSLTVSTPSTGTTGGRVVLAVDWTAQTARAVVVRNTDGTAAIPALVQTPGTLYQINLATFTITTGGVIAVTMETARAGMGSYPAITLAGCSLLGKSTAGSGAGEDVRAASDGLPLLRVDGALAYGQIATDGLENEAVAAAKLAAQMELVTGQIGSEAVDTIKLAASAVDDSKIGAAIPVLTARQGGDAAVWSTPGASNYTPGRVVVMAGCLSIRIWHSEYAHSTDLILPIAMKSPLVIVTLQSVTEYIYTHIFGVYAGAIDNTHIRFTAARLSSSFLSIDYDADVNIGFWVIGEPA